ncbi:MAG TPA: hypothetical protein VI756_21750, partial [Blastocatellia bacterium]
MPPKRQARLCFVIAILLGCCGSALAGGDSTYDGSGAFSVYRLSKRTELQIQMDYVTRLKSELASKPGDIPLETELGRTYF